MICLLFLRFIALQNVLLQGKYLILLSKFPVTTCALLFFKVYWHFGVNNVLWNHYHSVSGKLLNTVGFPLNIKADILLTLVAVA